MRRCSLCCDELDHSSTLLVQQHSSETCEHEGKIGGCFSRGQAVLLQHPGLLEGAADCQLRVPGGAAASSSLASERAAHFSEYLALLGRLGKKQLLELISFGSRFLSGLKGRHCSDQRAKGRKGKDAPTAAGFFHISPALSTVVMKDFIDSGSATSPLCLLKGSFSCSA